MLNQKPSGSEIAAKAKTMKLSKEPPITGTVNGKKIVFTKTDLGHLKNPDDAENGQVIGVMENDEIGDETGLPPGRYNIYMAKVNNEWKVYAESNGVIAAEALKTQVSYHTISDKHKAVEGINPKGWCFYLCLWDFCGWCLWGIYFCL